MDSIKVPPSAFQGQDEAAMPGSLLEASKIQEGLFLQEAL